MSDVNTTDTQEKVVLTQEDTKNIREYFKHFGVPQPDYLTEALSRFDGDQSLENQKWLKLKLCKAILESKHESFMDSMYDPVKENAEKATYELQFEFDVKDELGVDDKE